jgi:hypothetical protein
MIANARVLRTHASLRRAKKRSKVSRKVLRRLKSAIMNSPMRTAIANAIKTERLKKARKIAISGGINPKIPYSMGYPYSVI